MLEHTFEPVSQCCGLTQRQFMKGCPPDDDSVDLPAHLHSCTYSFFLGKIGQGTSFL